MMKLYNKVPGEIFNILRDPFFYMGMALLSQLVIQWWLAGTVPVISPAGEQFTANPTHMNSFPPAAERLMRWDMLILFVPVFTMNKVPGENSF